MHRSMHTELPVCTGLESYVTFKILFVLEALACGITSFSACRGMSRFSRSHPFLHLEVVRKFILELHRGLCETNQTSAMFAKSVSQRILQVFLLSLLNLARAPLSLNSCNTLNFLFSRNSYFIRFVPWCAKLN